jgi:hypothetical protein
MHSSYNKSFSFIFVLFLFLDVLISQVIFYYCESLKLPFFAFRLQKTNGSLPFPFSFCGKQAEVAVFR